MLWILGKWLPFSEPQPLHMVRVMDYSLREMTSQVSCTASPQSLGSCGPGKGRNQVQDPGEPGKVASSFWNSIFGAFPCGNLGRGQVLWPERPPWSRTAGPEPASTRVTRQSPSSQEDVLVPKPDVNQQQLLGSAILRTFLPRVWILKLNKPSLACMRWGI